MADKRAHLAQMNAVKLGEALTDEETRALIDSQGGRSLFLVEAIHGPYVTAIDGQQTISLLPGVVVRVPDEHAGPVRDLLRGLAMGSGQTLTFDSPGDAFVPDTGASAAAVQEAADAANAAAADPEAPLPTGDTQDGATDDETGEQGAGGGEGPWPGDEGYEAPDTEATTAVPDPADDVAAARSKRARGKAAGE